MLNGSSAKPDSSANRFISLNNLNGADQSTSLRTSARPSRSWWACRTI